MKDVIIIGAGGHGAEIDDYIKSYHRTTGQKGYNLVGFLDDDPSNYARYKFSAPLIGGIRAHKVIDGCYYVIGIANLKYRKLLVEKFKNEGARFTSLIHGTAFISGSAIIGEGSVIGPNANIGPNVTVGSFTLINARCSIGHDSVIGDYNAISHNVCFSGFTKIGNGNLLGINSATIPGIIVGDRNIVAAGMILDQNIGNDSIVFYRYKEKVIAVPKATKEHQYATISIDSEKNKRINNASAVL
jgi:sugar O-acyltransferase (sialic acid O-acetyltransferase NeuD family)